MTRHTRCASLGLTVGTRLMARDTVAVDTRARLATSWMFNACSLVRTVQTLMWTSNLARLLYARLERSHTGSGSVSGLPTIHQAKQNLLNECNPDFSQIDKSRPKIAAGRGVRPY